MRASRLLSLLLLLQTRGRMTARELADELEVSVRTVYRDVESLSAAGVPVYADRGPAGGYQLLGGYRTRLTGLTTAEAESLFLAGTPGAAAELGLGTVLAAAQLKLLAALPPELRDRAGRVRERFYLDVPGWFRDIEHPRFLAAVAEAVWSQRAIEVRYRRWGPKEVTRRLEPLGLILKAGVWYLAASAASGQEAQVRTYRVARILDLAATSEEFDRPADFDLAAYWRSWADGYRERLYRTEAKVRLSPRALDLLGYFMGPVVARAARETAGPPDEDGWVRAVLPIESVTLATWELLRCGADLEVLGPPELRDRMAEVVAELTEMYGAAAG